MTGHGYRSQGIVVGTRGSASQPSVRCFLRKGSDGDHTTSADRGARIDGLRLAAARSASLFFPRREGDAVTILDDTGFPKLGRRSAGVRRQYSGTLLGKTGNCQIPLCQCASRCLGRGEHRCAVFPIRLMGDPMRCPWGCSGVEGVQGVVARPGATTRE